MIEACPNLNDPEVARAFNEIKEATSEKTAYNIWSLNNGYGIDKAPNGAESILFNSLLAECKGDRRAAIRAKAALYGNRFREWFGDWLQEDKTNVSKVVDENGEPLMVYHSSRANFDTFDTTKIRNGGGFWFSVQRGEYGNDFVYPSFLSIKNPYNQYSAFDKKYGNGALDNIYKYLKRLENYQHRIISEKPDKPEYPESAFDEAYELLFGNQQFLSGTDLDPFYYRSREFRLNALNLGFDGETDAIYYVVVNPNQIKSAAGNREIEQPGTGFSLTDDNIYHHIQGRIIKTVRDAKDTLLDILKLYHDFHKYLDERITKNKRDQKTYNEQIQFVLDLFDLPSKTIYINDGGFIEFNDKLLSENFDAFKDRIGTHEKMRSVIQIGKLFSSLKSKFPNIKGIKFAVLKDANAKFENGYVYVNIDNVTPDTLIEECLHPFVDALYHENPELFDSLLKEARKEFPKLRAEIATTYSPKKFTTEDRHKELVTQALSRHYADIYQNGPKEETSIWKKALDWILNVLGISGVKDLGRNLTLGQLADALYRAEHVEVDQSYYSSTSFNLNQSYDDRAAEFLANSPAIQKAYDAQREDYIRSMNPTTEEERNRLARQFDLDRMAENTRGVIAKIAAEYDLKSDGITIASNGSNIPTYRATNEKGKYVAMLLNSMGKRLSDPNFAPIEARFLLDTVVGTNDISTIIMQMSRIYIEDFYQADAIQEVMKIIDPKGEMHRDDLVDTLTNMVTKAVLDPESTEFGKVKKINNAIINFVRKRFNLNTISEQAKCILIDAIAKNMSCCEYLERTNTEDLLHDVKWYEITGKESKVTPKNVIDAIKKGIKTQIRAQKSVTNVDEAKVLILNQMLAKLEDVDIENNPDDVLGVVADFIADGMQEISKANAELRQMQQLNPTEIDSKKLYSIRTDVVGYYRSIINNYIIPFTRNTTNPALQPGGALYATITSILDKCTHTQLLYDYVLGLHVEALIDQFVDSNVNIGDKERFKVNCKLWLHNKINNGDLGFFENWIKSAVSSHSPIVRLVDDFVRQLDTQVRQEATKQGRRLQRLYEKCEPRLAKRLPFNYQRGFCELDDDGQTTGNFLAEVNVGQFEKEKRQFINQWIENSDITMDEDGTLIFPDDETWKRFNDSYDDFLSGRQHRRYTADYYKLQREYMSRDTIEYKRNIRQRIQLLYEKCYDKEIDAPNIWDLERPDFQELQNLLKIQQNLSNPYIITYDSDGKIEKIEEKPADQLRMANEIAAFNKAIAGKISFTPNYEKYEKAKDAIKRKFGEDSNEYKVFVFNFSTSAVSPLYYERLREIFGQRSNEIIPELDDINNRIKAIINATLIKRGKYVPDLYKMNDAAYAELKRLEEEKEKLLDKYKTSSGKKLTPEQKQELDSMHHYAYIVNSQTNKPIIKELEEEYRSRGQYQQFLDKYFVTTGANVRPLSIFSYDVVAPMYMDYESPTGIFSDVDIFGSEFVDPEYDPEDNEFMNVDKNRYHNDKYDEMINDPQAYKFYKRMLDMMEEAWSYLPDINRHYKYMLPQRRGSISQLAARDIINKLTGKKGRQTIAVKQVLKNIVRFVTLGAIGGLMFGGVAALNPVFHLTMAAALISGIGYGAISGLVFGLLSRDKNISDQLLSITENDVQFNESYAIRPDGSEVETIPIRFVRRLDDPTSVSTDLIHSVTTFYEMALNYKQKEQLAPIVENIQFELSGGFNGQSVTDQADRIRTYKSAMIYGRRKTGLSRRSSNKMTQSEQKISKLVSYLLNTTHAKMLPWNGTSIYKNMIDSALSFISLISSVKQMTPQDLCAGIIDMGKELFNGTAWTNIGSVDTKSFTGAAMQYNGVHMGIPEEFKDTQKYWLRRVIERFYSMGPFTLIDYTFKGLMTRMVYNHYRLVLNPSTGEKEFMNKQEAQFAYASSKLGRKDGLKAWKNAKIRLKDAYVVTHSGLQLKPKYESLVRPEINGKKSYKLENRVSGLVREQSAVVNGMLDTQDINKVSQNFIGSMILLMRGWMVSQLIDYNKDGQDFAVFASNIEDINTKMFGNKTLGSLQSKFIGSLDSFVAQQAPSDFEGQYNFATGFVERGWWVGWTNLVKSMLANRRLTQHNKYQLKYLAMILATTVSLGLATHPLYNWRQQADEKYKDADPLNTEMVASNFLYTGTIAAYSERFGQIGPFGFLNSFLELVNSPTVASSYVKDLNTIIDATEDIFNVVDEMIQGQSIDQTTPMQTVVNRGSFKGRTKLTKDLLKASTEIPGINTFGVTNMYKTISPDAQKEKLKFYQKTIPFAGAQPWIKLPEPAQQKKGGSTKKNKPTNQWY